MGRMMGIPIDWSAGRMYARDPENTVFARHGPRTRGMSSAPTSAALGAAWRDGAAGVRRDRRQEPLPGWERSRHRPVVPSETGRTIDPHRQEPA